MKKRTVFVFVVLLAFMQHTFAQKIELPFWALNPKEGEFVGISLPGGDQMEAECMALYAISSVMNPPYLYQNLSEYYQNGEDLDVHKISTKEISYTVKKVEYLPTKEVIVLLSHGQERKGKLSVVEEYYVKDKFEAAGFGYLNAFLGNAKNVETFFEGEQAAVKINEKSVIGNSARYLRQTSDGVETYLQLSLDVAKIAQLISEYEVEKEINDAEYQIKERIVPKTLKDKKYTSAKLLELASVLETLSDDKVIGFFNRVRILFRFGIIGLKGIPQNKEDAIEYLKNKYYDVKISELNQAQVEKKNYIDSNNLTELLSKQKKLSYDIFKYALQERYKGLTDCNFTARNYRSKFGAFTRRYPVVYSTTHAIRSCSGENYLYDCVIIDESSQVDLISAVIAFSMAKKVVLVGDEKQLPHVVKSQLAPKLNNIFNILFIKLT